MKSMLIFSRPGCSFYVFFFEKSLHNPRSLSSSTELFLLELFLQFLVPPFRSMVHFELLFWVVFCLFLLFLWFLRRVLHKHGLISTELNMWKEISEDLQGIFLAAYFCLILCFTDATCLGLTKLALATSALFPQLRKQLRCVASPLY